MITKTLFRLKLLLFVLPALVSPFLFIIDGQQKAFCYYRKELPSFIDAFRSTMVGWGRAFIAGERVRL